MTTGLHARWDRNCQNIFREMQGKNRVEKRIFRFLGNRSWGGKSFTEGGVAGSTLGTGRKSKLRGKEGTKSTPICQLPGKAPRGKHLLFNSVWD